MSRRGDNIHKRKDGRWEGRYKCGIKDDGSTAYHSVYGQTYFECKDKLEKRKSTSYVTTKRYAKMNFSQLLELWLQENRIRIKSSTETKYRNMITLHIIPELGNKSISTITSTMVNNFLSKKLCETSRKDNSTLSASYVRTIAIIIDSALKFAACEGLCPPIKHPINKPSIPKQNLKIISSPDQKRIEEVLHNEKNTTSLGTLIALHTGMRIGEICALQWDDIDLDNKLIFVRHTISRVGTDDQKQKTKLIIDVPKTPSSFREIPIPSVLYSTLAEAHLTRRSNFVVSETESFVSTRTFDYRYRQLLKRNNLDIINFHAIRHTFATRCIEAGMDVKTLSEILGHASASITLNTYVHSSLESKRKQIEKLYATA
ncbi:MAG: site-specific integrase [Ruminococcus sp.]|nr:site-specific integrase [Ruminococcus sp.]